ncbi:MAG: hypothetical protein ACI9F9_001871 [Candidatus Paceibacteria bacterium]|jgi:hypothetical protein
MGEEGPLLGSAGPHELDGLPTRIRSMIGPARMRPSTGVNCVGRCAGSQETRIGNLLGTARAANGTAKGPPSVFNSRRHSTAGFLLEPWWFPTLLVLSGARYLRLPRLRDPTSHPISLRNPPTSSDLSRLPGTGDTSPTRGLQRARVTGLLNIPRTQTPPAAARAVEMARSAHGEIEDECHD